MECVVQFNAKATECSLANGTSHYNRLSSVDLFRPALSYQILFSGSLPALARSEPFLRGSDTKRCYVRVWYAAKRSSYRLLFSRLKVLKISERCEGLGRYGEPLAREL